MKENRRKLSEIGYDKLGLNAAKITLALLVAFIIWLFLVNVEGSPAFEIGKQPIKKAILQYWLQLLAFSINGVLLSSFFALQAVEMMTRGIRIEDLDVGRGNAWNQGSWLVRMFMRRRRFPLASSGSGGASSDGVSGGAFKSGKAQGVRDVFLGLSYESRHALIIVFCVAAIVLTQAVAVDLTQDFVRGERSGKIGKIEVGEATNFFLEQSRKSLDVEARIYEKMERFKHWTTLRRQGGQCVSDPTFYRDLDTLTAGINLSAIKDNSYIGFDSLNGPVLQTCVVCNPVLEKPSNASIDYSFQLSSRTEDAKFDIPDKVSGKSFGLSGTVPGYGSWSSECVIQERLVEEFGGLRAGNWLQVGPDVAFAGKVDQVLTGIAQEKLIKLGQILSSNGTGCNNPEPGTGEERWTASQRQQECVDRWTALKYEFKNFLLRDGLPIADALSRRMQEYVARNLAAQLNDHLWNGPANFTSKISMVPIGFTTRVAGTIGGHAFKSWLFWLFVALVSVSCIIAAAEAYYTRGVARLAKDTIETTVGMVRSELRVVRGLENRFSHVCTYGSTDQELQHLAKNRVWFGPNDGHIGMAVDKSYIKYLPDEEYGGEI